MDSKILMKKKQFTEYKNKHFNLKCFNILQFQIANISNEQKWRRQKNNFDL